MGKNGGGNKQTKLTGGLHRTRQAGEFFGDVKGELFKISWTSKEELQVYTRIVVIATFVLGMCIYGMDLVIQNVLAGLGAFIRLITG